MRVLVQPIHEKNLLKYPDYSKLKVHVNNYNYAKEDISDDQLWRITGTPEDLKEFTSSDQVMVLTSDAAELTSKAWDAEKLKRYPPEVIKVGLLAKVKNFILRK